MKAKASKAPSKKSNKHIPVKNKLFPIVVIGASAGGLQHIAQY